MSRKTPTKIQDTDLSKFSALYQKKTKGWQHIAYSCLKCNGRFMTSLTMENHKCKMDAKYIKGD